MPLELGFRRSSLDSSGLVLQAENKGNGSLSCRVIATNKTVQQHTDYPFTVGPYRMAENGILETGWSFKTGEQEGICVEGFSPVYLTVP